MRLFGRIYHDCLDEDVSLDLQLDALRHMDRPMPD